MRREVRRSPRLWNILRNAGAALFLAACAGAAMWSVMATAVNAGHGPKSVAEIAGDLSNAVVNISTEQKLRGPAETAVPKGPEGQSQEDLFEDFLNRQNRGEGARRVSSLGSGFIIDPKGLILTNNHVIEGADEIYAVLADGTRLKVVEVVGRDVKVDLALLGVAPAKPLPSVPFGDSSKMRVGDWVMAIGNPFGLGGSVSMGIISATHRNINAGPYDEFLQTDAAINRGNSGGPLFNMDGEVVGVNTAIISPTGGSIGIGFALPSNIVSQAVDQLRKYGQVRRGWLGVRIQKIGEDIAESVGLPAKGGALIASVTPNGPGSRAGMQVGDIILTYDGQDVNEMRGLPRQVAQTEIGKLVDIGLWRKGERLTIKARVEKLDEGAPMVKARKPEPKPVEQHRLLGLAFSAMSDELRTRFDIDKALNGVVVTGVDAASEAGEKSIKPGDVILEVTNEKVRTPADIIKRVRDLKALKRRTVLLLVADAHGSLNFVAVPIAE
jgi:serine protease Do